MQFMFFFISLQVRPIGLLCSQNFLNYLAFQPFDIERHLMVIAETCRGLFITCITLYMYNQDFHGGGTRLNIACIELLVLLLFLVLMYNGQH